MYYTCGRIIDPDGCVDCQRSAPLWVQRYRYYACGRIIDPDVCVDCQRSAPLWVKRHMYYTVVVVWPVVPQLQMSTLTVKASTRVGPETHVLYCSVACRTPGPNGCVDCQGPAHSCGGPGGCIGSQGPAPLYGHWTALVSSPV